MILPSNGIPRRSIALAKVHASNSEETRGQHRQQEDQSQPSTDFGGTCLLLSAGSPTPRLGFKLRRMVQDKNDTSNSCIIWRTLNLKGDSWMLVCNWIYIVFASHGGQYIFDQICKFSHVHFPRENGSVTLGDLITVTGTNRTTISSNLTIFTGRRISVRFHHPPLYLCHQDLPLLPATQGFILPTNVLAIQKFMSPLAIFSPEKNNILNNQTGKYNHDTPMVLQSHLGPSKSRVCSCKRFEAWPSET